MDKLLKYLNALPRPAQAVFAQSCGTSVGYLRKAASSNQLLNIITCVAIEHETFGEVTRKDLRPADWHKIWPELNRAGGRRASDRTEDFPS